jgi:hypothetical protein
LKIQIKQRFLNRSHLSLRSKVNEVTLTEKEKGTFVLNGYSVHRNQGPDVKTEQQNLELFSRNGKAREMTPPESLIHQSNFPCESRLK